MCLATALTALAALPFTNLVVTPGDLALLAMFGVGQMGLGLVLFTAGDHLIPAADAGRSTGFFRCSRSIRFDSPVGTTGLTARGGTGSFSPTAARIAEVVGAAKADRPVAARYKTLPRLNRSERASRARPLTCSPGPRSRRW